MAVVKLISAAAVSSAWAMARCDEHKPHTSLTVAAAVTDMQAELHLIGKKVSCMEGRQAARQLGSNFINPIGSEEFSSKIITLISLLSIRGETHKW